MRKVIIVLVVILLFKVLFVIWSEHKQTVAELLPIKYVRIEGVFQYISKETIRQALQPYVKTDFFSVDMQVIHKVVMQLPWMKKVTVKRVWPDAIDIKVYEQIPAVRWGEKSLLNPAGELFTPESVAEFQDLPLIVGPKGYEARLLAIMKGLETTLAEHSLHLAEFKVNERRAWEIVLKNGMVIKLGRNGQLKNFNRFLKTLDLLGQDKVDAISKVDLRYPNGFAITWKIDTPAIDWKSMAARQLKPQ